MHSPSEAWVNDQSTNSCPTCGVLVGNEEVGNEEGSKRVHRKWHLFVEVMSGTPVDGVGAGVETAKPERPKRVSWHGDPIDLTVDEYLELTSLALDHPVAANEKARAYWERQNPEENNGP